MVCSKCKKDIATINMYLIENKAICNKCLEKALEKLNTFKDCGGQPLLGPMERSVLRVSPIGN